MTCPFNPLDCATGAISGAVGAIGAATGNALADAMRAGSEWVLRTTTGWWVNVPSIELTTSPAGAIRSLTLPLAGLIAAAGIVWQGVVMAASRKRDPLVNVARGVVTVAVWSAVGIGGVSLAMGASDSFAAAALDAGAQGQAAARLAEMGALAGVNSAGVIIVLGLIMILAGLAQAVLMMIREGTLVVLAGLVVVAAAGSFSGATRPWLHKWLARTLALVVYKPAVAVIYFAAFRMLGDQTGDPRLAIIGLGMLLLSIIALPSLVRFFDWAIPAASHSGGGLATVAGVASAAIYAKAAHDRTGSGGGDPVGFAREIASSTPAGPAGAAPAAGGPAAVGLAVAHQAVQAAGRAVEGGSGGDGHG